MAPRLRHIVVLQCAKLQGRQVVDRGRRQGDGHGDGDEDGGQDDLGEEGAPVAGDVVEALDDDGLEVVEQQQVWLQHVASPAPPAGCAESRWRLKAKQRRMPLIVTHFAMPPYTACHPW